MDASRHAAHSISAGEWLATLERGTVTLGYADRCRHHVRLMDDAGMPFLLDLARPARLSEGDGLVLTDGTILRVIAKPEPLLEVTRGDVVESLHCGTIAVATPMGDVVAAVGDVESVCFMRS